MRAAVTREILLPLLFFLRGEKVRREYGKLLASERVSVASLEDLQLDKLRALLEAAYIGNEFYRRRMSECGITSRSVRTLADLALMPFLEKQDLHALRQSAEKQLSLFGQKLVRKTAGSSGDPSVVLACPTADARSLAARYRAFHALGIRPGDQELRLWGRPLSRGRWKQRLKSALLNRVLIDPFAVSHRDLELLVKGSHGGTGSYLYGYTSLVQSFADRWRTMAGAGVSSHLKGAVCTSETSSRAERQWMADVLGCPVVNEYGCSEVDIIAFECPSGRLHVVSENIYVELISFGGEPPGYREVVVTDLNNTLMPLIRYRLGDLSAWDEVPCDCGRQTPILTEVMGRRQWQFIRTGAGRQIHTQTIAYIFENLVEEGFSIRRFQIIQKGVENLLILIVTKDARESERNDIVRIVNRELRELLRGEIAYECRFVRPEDLRRPRGKFRHLISEE